MSPRAQPHQAIEHKRALTKKDREERKQRLQSHGRSSVTRSIAHAVVLKEGDLFLVSEPDGSIPLDGEHGCGLYYHDCRFLNGYEFRLGNANPSMLASSAASGFKSVIELTNPDLKINGRLIPKETVGIKWERMLDGANRAVFEILTFHNYGFEPVELPITLTFASRFEPLFAVRGLLGMKLGHNRPSSWENGTLQLGYEGADHVARSLGIGFSPAPQSTEERRALFHVALSSEQEKEIRLCLSITETEAGNRHTAQREQINFSELQTRLEKSSGQWLSETSEIRTDSPLLRNLVERSMRDLRMLKSSLDGQEFFAAGIPWFVALFGRDSLIACIETLAYSPAVAENTLRIMAKYQGRSTDEWRDEQPGKIMHELRVGELAHLHEIPQTPYYGTIDATPLFLVLMACHAAWTGELSLFDELQPAVEAALKWIDEYGDQNGDGYVEYQSASKKGLINQGWKDSGDAIVNLDGSLAQPPISLVEVQGYVYLAKILLTGLYERAGDAERARRLRQQAETLRSRFNRDFWLADRKFYALALQDGKRPAAVISSNPGQALWTGIVDPDKARSVVERLMAEDMFSGWGIRTLSAKERRYNPIGYHLGTVWPHDNAITAAGFRRYGFSEEACRVFAAIAEAAPHFEHDRLPEVFAGFSRDAYGIPVRYPVACHPQAWAAGAVPYLVETALGLTPEAFDHRLRVVRPVLPEFVSHLEIRRLRVGRGRADLRFERKPDGTAAVTVIKVEGTLEVVTGHGAENPVERSNDGAAANP